MKLRNVESVGLYTSLSNKFYWCLGEGKPNHDGLASVFEQIERVITVLHQDKKSISIIIDDISFLEVAANGSSDDVLNLMHYCHTLTSEYVR